MEVKQKTAKCSTVMNVSVLRRRVWRGVSEHTDVFACVLSDQRLLKEQTCLTNNQQPIAKTETRKMLLFKPQLCFYLSHLKSRGVICLFKLRH